MTESALSKVLGLYQVFNNVWALKINGSVGVSNRVLFSKGLEFYCKWQ